MNKLNTNVKAETKPLLANRFYLIDGLNDDLIKGILMNIEDYMPKAKRKRTTNIRIIQDFILKRTSKGGRTSAIEQCLLLGFEPDAYTFY